MGTPTSLMEPTPEVLRDPKPGVSVISAIGDRNYGFGYIRHVLRTT